MSSDLPDASVRAAPRYPTGKLIAVTLGTGIALLVLWTGLRLGGTIEPSMYQSVAVGLMASTIAHILGVLGGAVLASSSAIGASVMTAYLGSTVIRFLLAPLVTVSLYFALPVTHQPLLIGAGAGYLLILVADIATMLMAMTGSAGSSSTPRV